MKINRDLLQTEKAKESSISFNTSMLKNPLNRFPDKQKEGFYREFSTLIKSGVDFNQALKLLTEQQENKFLKTVYSTINEDVIKGKSLYESLQQFSFFSPYEYYSIKIGEETKRLPQIFDQLQKFYTRKIKMKRQVFSVLAYPVFVLVITFAVLYFMLSYVVPMFAKVFQQFGKELPKITQFVVKLSDNFSVVATLVFIFIISLFVSHHLLKNNTSYKRILSSVLLKIPFFGSLLKKIYLARFCQSLSLLLAAKTPLVEALDLTHKMISFYPLKVAIEKIKYDILKGDTFANSLKKHSFFSPKIISLTTIGEQINELDQMYDGLANQYNEEIEHSTKIIGTILEPVMIVLIGGIVGFIMVAMYSPLFDLSKILEN